MLAGGNKVKLSTLWAFFIGSCAGEIVTLILEQDGKWGNVFLYLIVIIPAIALTIYTERFLHPRKKKLPVRRASRTVKPRSLKAVR